MKHRLQELAFLFLKLGCTSFGGPAAHIAMMEEEVVKRRQWMTPEAFLDLIGATNLIPGPNSTEMAIHIGFKYAGGLGLLVAGCCFIFPAVVLTGLIAWFYVRFGTLPETQSILYGIKPVLIAVVFQALLRLSKSALKTKSFLGIALMITGLSFWGVNELLLLFGTGFSLIIFLPLIQKFSFKTEISAPTLLPAVPLLGANGVLLGAGGTVATSFGLWPLFLLFLKVGSILFGSGYVLLAFLRADLVDRFQWLSESQLLEAIAVGQMTPGPVFSTATFIGYLLGGLPGAGVATLGIFLPSFFLVAMSAPLVPRLRASVRFGAFLDGVNVASLSLMFVVTVQLAQVSFIDIYSFFIGVGSALLLLRYQLNSTWLILGGGALGILIHQF